ncbi:Peptidase M16 [Hirschfeldia incana]|nr:Peptidase M16 [Hirschfeldia incana]
MGLFKMKYKRKWLQKMKKDRRALRNLIQLAEQRLAPVSETYLINRPDASPKVYKSIVLPNGLTVLLISDKSSLSNAASISVKFGNFDDPPEMQGLAHLIEHMIFCGSTSNDGVNDFKEFVGMHGGDVFAKTEPEYMGFAFTIVKDHFKAALEMFGSMFSEPLMNIERFEKEIMTLNSEFESYKYKDSCRLEQLLSHTSHKNHPFNRFPWGNKKSFSGQNVDADACCERAKNLFQRHFIGASMKLVIIGSDAVNELQHMVIDFFAKIKRGIKSDFVFPTFNEPLWKHGVSYTLESLEGAQCMRVTWIIPPVTLVHSERRSAHLIHKLFCEECEGSLCYFLKSKHWISSLTASVGHECSFTDIGDCSFTSTAGGQLFYISLDITDTGLDNKYEIVSYIYQYLHFLKTCGSSQLLLSLIEEYKFSLEMKYQCLELDSEQLGDLINFSLALAVNMLSFPVSHALSLDYCYHFGDINALQEILGYFSTKNMRIDLLSKPFAKDDETKDEPYFSSKYKEEQIPLHFIEKWETSKVLDSALRLPQRNRFMPGTAFWRNDFDEMEENPEEAHDMYEEEYAELDEMEENPDEADEDEASFQPIAVGDYNKLFLQYEEAPFSTASFKIYMNVSQEAKAHMVFRIFLEMVKDQLSPILYKGEEAYISCELSFGDDSTIELKLYGYAARFKDFLSTIWETFCSFVPSLEAFETITEKMLRQFYLTSRDLIVHAKQLLSESIIEGQLSMFEKFNAMKLISYEDLTAFIPKMQQIRVVGLFTGKYSEDDCREILDLFNPIGNFEIPRISPTKRDLAICSPHRVSAKPIIENETNSLAKVYYQVSCEQNSSDFNPIMMSAFLLLLKSMVDEKIYADLRLEQRLGYHVGCEIHNQHGTKGVYFYVVSCDHKLVHLLEKIHDFVAAIPHYLANVDDKTFENYRSGTDVPGDSGMSPDLIHDGSCVNGHHTAVRFVLKKMKKEDVIKLCSQFFLQEPSIVEVCIGSDV